MEWKKMKWNAVARMEGNIYYGMQGLKWRGTDVMECSG
jgi:hypothetical protein